jgi:hypothetical protein
MAVNSGTARFLIPSRVGPIAIPDKGEPANELRRREGRVRQRILAHGLGNDYKARAHWDGSHLKDVAPMLSSDLDRLTPTQRLVVEQALVLAKELEATADNAPEGQIIDRCESLLLGEGRDFLRRVLESTIQSRAEALEKKAATRGPATPVEPPPGTRGARPRK